MRDEGNDCVRVRAGRVRGYRDVQYLVGALDALAPPDDVVAEVA